MTAKKSEPIDAAAFFDRNASVYGPGGGVDVREVTLSEPYRAFFELIKKSPLDETLLDVGAGSGLFSRLVKLHLPDMRVTALDPSVKLLNMIEDRSIKKVVGSLPDLNLDPKAKFSFMMVTNVFHHLVGKTTEESRNIVKESLVALREHLDDSGLLMVTEVLWETYMIPTASRAVTFFLLSVFRRLNLAVPWFVTPDNKESASGGLLVCMYTALELETLLKDCGFETVWFRQCLHPLPTSPVRTKWFKRFMFLQRLGSMHFVVRKANTAHKQISTATQHLFT